PFLRAAAYHRSIGSDDEDLLPVRNRSSAASTLQIPSGCAARHEGNGRGAINLAADKDKARAFRNAQRVSVAHLDVDGRPGPAIDIGLDMDDKAARYRLTLQLRHDLVLLLLDHFQCRGLLVARARRDAGGSGAGFNLRDQFLAAFCFESGHLRSCENGAGRVCILTKAARAPQNIAQMLAGIEAVAAGVGYFAFDDDGGSDIVPAREPVNGEHVAGPESDICGMVRFRHCIANGNVLTLDNYARAVPLPIAGQVGLAQERIALESACCAYQL